MSEGELRFVDSWPTAEEAKERIAEIQEMLARTSLTDRYGVLPTPREISSARMRASGKRYNTLKRYYFGVYIIDRFPHLPPPEGLSFASLSAPSESDAPAVQRPGRRAKLYEAFGQKMSIPEWARAVGVTGQTIRNHLTNGEDLESILTNLATKRR